MSFDLGQYIAQIFQGLRGPAQVGSIPGVDGTSRPTGYGGDDAAALRTSAVYGVRG